MVSPTFGGGHQMEMQFGGPQMNLQHMPLGSGHQMEMLQQPPPTNIPPPQMNSTQFPLAAVGNQLPPNDKLGEHRIESKQQEQEEKKEDSNTKPVESSTAENNEGDKMDICDTWEQEKVQRLAEEVEKFEQEVMNIERNSSKSDADNTAVETSSITAGAEKTKAEPVIKQEKKSIDEAKMGDTDLGGGSEVVKETKEDVIDNEVKCGESTEETSKVETNGVETGESEGIKTDQATTTREVADNPSVLEQYTSAVEGTNTEEKKMADEKTALLAETNAASSDDAMDLQDSSSETNGDPPQQLTADDV